MTDLLAQSPDADVLSASADQSPGEHDGEAAKPVPVYSATHNAWNRDAVDQLLYDLFALEQMLGQVPRATRASLLAQALRQEITILQRTVPAMPLTPTMASPDARASTTKSRTRPGRMKNTASRASGD